MDNLSKKKEKIGIIYPKIKGGFRMATKGYKTNPFRDAITHTIRGVSTVYSSPSKNDNFAMISKETGKQLRDVTFGKRITVDKTKFLKLYAGGVKMFLNLSPAGIKVFMLIYDDLVSNNNYQADNVLLNYDMLSNEIQSQISRSTFYNGIANLKKANFLAPTLQASRYWINTDYVFRGNRLTLINQYILEEKEKYTKENKKILNSTEANIDIKNNALKQ